MIVVPIFSNVHGQLDAQIVQLMQCKPLPEQEVCACACVCFFSFLSDCLSCFVSLCSYYVLPGSLLLIAFCRS
jgi:hypothetical protein